eukprot:m.110230 g.110230  ORF g.110230 m.110230 type:complete len:569 (-) comp15363_c0_seq1:121-1827(-)
MSAAKHPLLLQAKRLVLARSPPRIEPEPQEGNTEYKLKLVNIQPERFQHLITQMSWRLAEGGGECVYQIGVADDGAVLGLSPLELDASLHTLATMAEAVGAQITVLHQRPSYDASGHVAEVHLRRVPEEQHFIDVRALFLGDSAAGKSTLIAVLGSGVLEKEAGAARLNLFRHNHEILTGRTSTLNTEVLGFNGHGEVVNYQSDGDVATVAEVCDRANKLLHLRDSPGHSKYNKTTMRALSDPQLDYVFIAVAANMGFSARAKEHLTLAVALQRHVIVVVTKLDTCTKERLKETLREVLSAVKSPSCERVPMLMKNKEDVISVSQDIVSNNILPIVLTSAVTGKGLDLLKTMLNLLPVDLRHRNQQRAAQPVCFRVEDTFQLPETGTVVAGQMVQGVVRVGDELLIGPNSEDDFDSVVVKDIHRNRTPVRAAQAGEMASFAIDYKQARRGQVLVPVTADLPAICLSFRAELILTQPGLLEDGTQVIVYVQNVRQHAVIQDLSPPALEVGQSATATFVLQSRAEVIEAGARVVFQNERVKGIGTVVCESVAETEGTQSPDESLELELEM